MMCIIHSSEYFMVFFRNITFNKWNKNKVNQILKDIQPN